MLRKHFNRIVMIACAITLASFSFAASHAANTSNTNASYTFKVHNKTDQNIVKLLASPDGKSYSNFDIGSGIASGKTVTMQWSASTDDGNCEWFFKAKLEDGEETDPVEFDFCEKDLLLEIE